LEELVVHIDLERNFLSKTQEKYSELVLENSKLKAELLKLANVEQEIQVLIRQNESDLKEILAESKELNIFGLPVETLKRGAKRVLEFCSSQVELGRSMAEICQKNDQFRFLFDDGILQNFIKICKDGMMKKSWFLETSFWDFLLIVDDVNIVTVVSRVNALKLTLDLKILEVIKTLFTTCLIVDLISFMMKRHDVVEQYYLESAIMRDIKSLETIKKIFSVLQKMPIKFELEK
jgi:hypothetical protein